MHFSNSNDPMRFRAVSIVLLVILPLTTGIFLSCSRKPEPATLSSTDSLIIAQDNIAHRSEVDSSFRYDEGSPFKRDTTVEYHGIKWFPIDPRYRGISLLHRYVNAETVIVLGTKGEERKQLRYGYFTLTVPDDQGQPIVLRINVYKFTPYDTKRYTLYRDALSVWFTDATTGKETYGVGRYVEVGNEDADPEHPYVIDFNKAYNPYCAYSNLFSCAVPRKEDHLDIALRVGEMKYHE
jgi:uncharacterized protein (DUF1684 family)